MSNAEAQKLCPKCKQPGFEEHVEEVDIGVGIQTFYTGGECQTCGPIGVCGQCHAHTFEPHWEWCGKPVDDDDLPF
jgi:hypothetical protein